MSRTRSILGLAVSVLLCFSTTVVSVMAAPDEWYASLSKPSFNPPNWIFGPVWTTLYLMMGVAAWGVWRYGRNCRAALTLFAIQLALNAAWSPLFFGLHRPDLALIDLIALWIAIVVTIVAFHRQVRWAAMLLLPYLAWVSFAGVLNFAIWRLNA